MIYFDTSVLVASLIEDHPHFEKSFSWLEKIISGKEQGLISSHTLGELYSVLTTIPVKPRINPFIVNKLIQDTIKKKFLIKTISTSEYGQIIEDCSSQLLAGSVIYDAIHIYIAKREKAKIILTWNLNNFLAIYPEGKKIIREP